MVQGSSIGRSPVVCRIMKGIRLRRPPKSKYGSVWDVNLIFKLFEDWPGNRYLGLRELTWKLACLLCLVSIKSFGCESFGCKFKVLSTSGSNV